MIQRLPFPDRLPGAPDHSVFTTGCPIGFTNGIGPKLSLLLCPSHHPHSHTNCSSSRFPHFINNTTFYLVTKANIPEVISASLSDPLHAIHHHVLHIPASEICHHHNPSHQHLSPTCLKQCLYLSLCFHSSCFPNHSGHSSHSNS